MKHLLIITLATGLLLCGNAYSQDDEAPAEEKKLGWEGSGEFGLVSATGNSETFALNFSASILYNTEHWTHRFAASAINTSEDGETDAERYTAELQSNRVLTVKSWLFVAYRYDADKFGPYDPQQSLSTGYGRELMKSENHFLKGEIGIGYRKLDERESGFDSDSAIARFLLDDSWQIWESTLWTNRLLVEAGSDNTFSQFDTGLAVSMTTRFSVKLGFQIRNNTKLPPGDSENTDTTTTVNLVYNF
jgi:putative salt-induced outer membrane protein